MRRLVGKKKSKILPSAMSNSSTDTGEGHTKGSWELVESTQEWVDYVQLYAKFRRYPMCTGTAGEAIDDIAPKFILSTTPSGKQPESNSVTQEYKTVLGLFLLAALDNETSQALVCAEEAGWLRSHRFAASPGS